MGLFDWIKISSEALKQVEDKMYQQKNDFIEVYQRNIALEKEIAQRTEELRKANQTLLTLEHVWDMMNSSRPLSSVLETIVSSLHGEFGYLYSCILQKQLDTQGVFYAFKTYLQNTFSNELEKCIPNNLFETRFNINEGSYLYDVLKNKEIKYFNNLREVLTQILPFEVSEEKINEFKSKNPAKSLIVLPIVSKEFTGLLMVFSPREDTKDSELNFLNLFARQIELAITIANLFETVKKQAVTDPLTELFNRRFYEDALSREAVRALRLNQPFTLISLDLDKLKHINDTLGHSAGDAAIKAVAKVINKNSRSVDVPSRVGGEEFTIILPGVDSQGGLIAAERIRSSLENEYVEGVGHITASIGVATFIEMTTDVDELVEIADKAMYFAKQNGRNQVKLAEVQDSVSWQDIAIDAFVQILDQHKIPFGRKTADELIKKLQSKQETNNGILAKELLFDVVDTISKTYTPYYESGTTKQKIELAYAIAKRFELSKNDMDKLKLAMLLYDIGNVLIPNDVLSKKTPLTKEEKEVITKHPIIGAQEILKPISHVSSIIPIIVHHHENWDGSGYPDKRKGDDIPLISQIILIVDSYYAMISDRPYRKAYSKEEAIAEIESLAGKKYSEELVREFKNAIKEIEA
ncbi:TPA: diguanylate cyclase [Candidatus Galligastranaerophilus gallistercoris]|nr:diguanylate cyclase [Candidatus Galligastranaerophilus gallistercoris]